MKHLPKQNITLTADEQTQSIS